MSVVRLCGPRRLTLFGDSLERDVFSAVLGVRAASPSPAPAREPRSHWTWTLWDRGFLVTPSGTRWPGTQSYFPGLVVRAGGPLRTPRNPGPYRLLRGPGTFHKPSP